MTRVVVLVWLGAPAALGSFEPHLEAWAGAHGVALERAEASATRTAGYDDRLVERIESDLERARVRASSLEHEAALEILRRVEEDLTEHPELPQAAWLMAERLRVEATVLDRRGVGGDEARALRGRADVLEGRRAAVFVPSARDGTVQAPARAAPALRRVVFTGLRKGDSLYVDGRPSRPPAAVAEGRHHVRVVRRGRAAWAGWIDVEGGGDLPLPIPRAEPCSTADLGAVRIAGGRVVTPRDARCPDWIVARPHGRAGVEVARCREASCGRLFEWRRGLGAEYGGPPQPAAAGRPIPWATYALLGAGAVVATGMALWKSGLFDEPERGKTRRVYRGPDLAAFRF